MLQLALVLSLYVAQSGPDPEAPLNRCEFTGPCTSEGLCTPITFSGRPECGHASAETCKLSAECVRYGACGWPPDRSPALSCWGGEPKACAADKPPCKLYGNCRFTKPDTQPCGATAKGCRESELCRVTGECGYKQGFCYQTAKGCRESFQCRFWGECALHSSGERCKPTVEGCANSLWCKQSGMCVASDLICTKRTTADCQQSDLCSVFGQCYFGSRQCAPDDTMCGTTGCVHTIERPCQDSLICQRYGACTPSGGECVLTAADGSHPWRVRPWCKAARAECLITTGPVPESATCEERVIRVARAKVPHTHPDLGPLHFAAEHLVDQNHRTAWMPDPNVPLPHRLEFELDRPHRIIGLRLHGGLKGNHPTEGPLFKAHGYPDGVAFLVGGKPVAALRVPIEDRRFAPVVTDRFEVEVFYSTPGHRTDTYGISDVELVTCVQ